MRRRPDRNRPGLRRYIVNMPAKHAMKIVSIVLILAYLVLPAICCGHQCELLAAHSPHGTVASDASGECPADHDADNCETTCCCAGHLPLAAFAEIPAAGLIAGLAPHDPLLALPRLMDEIVVPPQNRSGTL